MKQPKRTLRKTLKFIFLLLASALIAFIVLILYSRLPDKRLKISIKEVGKINYYQRYSSAKITLELKNLSSDTLTFLTWSCDCEGLFSIDEKDVHLNSWECMVNNPVLLKIPPYDVFARVIEIVNPSENIQPFRIKANLVKPREKNDPNKAQSEFLKKEFSLQTDYIQIK
jgi:hypothetical protein